MKNIFLLLILTFTSLSTSNIFAQSYSTGFDNATEQSGWNQYRVGVSDPFYEWEYTTSDALSAPNCILHNYHVGGSEITDDWFVSPIFDFSEGGTIDSVWHRFSGFGLPMSGDTVALYVINGSADPDLATSKTLLFNYVDSNYVNDAVWRLRTNIEIPTLSGDSYLAFRYKTIVNWLDVRFDDLKVTSNESTGIEKINVDHLLIQVFPNPVNDFLLIKPENSINIQSLTLFSIDGEEIKRLPISENKISLENLEKGFYILRINTNQGVFTKKLLKE